LQSQANVPLHYRSHEPGKFSEETVASLLKRKAQQARGPRPQQQMKKGKKMMRRQRDADQELETNEQTVRQYVIDVNLKLITLLVLP
jgi:hypothetical protein